jgi:hypothetical protein
MRGGSEHCGVVGKEAEALKASMLQHLDDDSTTDVSRSLAAIVQS